MFSFLLAYKITHLKLACLAIDSKSYYIGVNTPLVIYGDL